MWGTAAQGESLSEALILAYINNPTLQAQRASLRATDEGVPQALSGWRPTVEIVSDGSVVTQDGNATNAETRGRYSANLRVTQNLYSGGGTVADIERAEDTVLAERARLAATEQDVLFNAVQAYMNVFRDEAVLRLNINNEKVLARQLEATRDRFNVGEVTRTDVSQAEARLSRATADRIQAEGDLQISKGVYQQIVGQEPGKLSPPPDVKDLPSSRQESVAMAQDNNPSVRAAFFDERSARKNVSLVRSELLPRVDLVGEGGRAKNQSSTGTVRDSASVTAQLTVPLYQRGSVSSRVREAKQLVGQNRLRLLEAKRQATEDGNSAWESLITARARIRSFSAEVRANRIALEGVQQEALVGSRTVLDVLDAEQELLDAQVNLVRAERDEAVAQYDLLSAVGRLTASDLSLDTQIYDPQKYYNDVRDKLWGLGDSTDSQKTDKGKKQ
ncbi:MAG: TolC family outer membrane protein [Alphaproteobacteria bacterium]|nr:TolC family outer membrane protein [Alphaproteobacteria bacterium]